MLTFPPPRYAPRRPPTDSTLNTLLVEGVFWGPWCRRIVQYSGISGIDSQFLGMSCIFYGPDRHVYIALEWRGLYDHGLLSLLAVLSLFQKGRAGT
ncbi:hypothetical protein BDQ12DRAFT_682268, partial [Crucibulum laeve]